MGGTLFHRNDRIEQYLEIGSCIALGMGSYRRGQMATGREAHDAYIIRIDVPFLGMTAHQTHSLVSILLGNGIVAMRHTIFYHDEGNALTCEERSPVVTFMLHGQVLIASTRTADYGTPRSLIGTGQIDPHLSLVFRVAIVGIIFCFYLYSLGLVPNCFLKTVEK